MKNNLKTHKRDLRTWCDLIVLSMKQQKQGIRLLREPQNTSTEIMELHIIRIHIF